MWGNQPGVDDSTLELMQLYGVGAEYQMIFGAAMWTAGALTLVSPVLGDEAIGIPMMTMGPRIAFGGFVKRQVGQYADDQIQERSASAKFVGVGVREFPNY